MRLLFLIAGLFACSQSFAQNNITGRWKPVFFNIDSMITGGVNDDTALLSPKLDEQLKNDKDPRASKELMVFTGNMLLEKMKVTQEEFTASGEYVTTNTRRNKSTKGKYSLDGNNNLVIKTGENEPGQYKVSFKNGNLVLTGEMEGGQGKKGKLVVEYERVK